MRHDRNGQRTKGSVTKEMIDRACTNRMASTVVIESDFEIERVFVRKDTEKCQDK